MATNDPHRNKRSSHVSLQQLELLCEFLESNRDIAVAHNRSLTAKEHARQKWMEITEVLNDEGKATKDWRGWSKYWVDFKAKLKKRLSSTTQFGLEGNTEPPLSDIENKMIQIIENSIKKPPDIQEKPISERHIVFIQDQQPENPGLQVILKVEDSSDCLNPAVPSPPPLVALPPRVSPPNPQNSPPKQPVSPSPRVSPSPQSPSLPQQSPSLPPPRSEQTKKRRRRHATPMTQEAARRALVQSSQARAEAAVENSQSLKMLVEEMREIRRSLQRIEGALNTAVD